MAADLTNKDTIFAYYNRLLELLPNLTKILEEEESSQEMMLKFLRLVSKHNKHSVNYIFLVYFIYPYVLRSYFIDAGKCDEGDEKF